MNQGSKDRTSIQITEHVIKRLFIRFSVIYGHKWTSIYPNDESIVLASREWKPSLIKLTIKDIQKGIEYCKANLEWPPSLPEFIRYCQPDYGLPDAYSAYKEAANAAHCVNEHQWSHPVVYHTAKKIGFYDLKQKPENQTKPLFEHIYQTLCRRVKNGEKLDDPVPSALTHEPLKKSSPKVANEYLGKIYELLKVAPSEDSLTYNKKEKEE